MSRDRDRARPDTRLSSSDNESDDEDYQLPHSHPEYGSDSSDQDFELNNVGKFCPLPWKPDVARLCADTNKLFRCFIRCRLNSGPFHDALRRALFDIHMIGRMGYRLKHAEWETIMNLTPRQSLHLRRTLRDADSRSAHPISDIYASDSIFHPIAASSGTISSDCDVKGMNDLSVDSKLH